MEATPAVQDDEASLPLDPTCPVCDGSHDADEVFDGSERRCASCGHTLVCVTYINGTARMQCYSNCAECRTARTKQQRKLARRGRQRRRGW